MSCFKPLQALYTSNFTTKGKREVMVLKRSISKQFVGNPNVFDIPCGRCIGCRLERSRQWAIRCVHESSLYLNNSFITLTFNDESLYSRSRPFSLDVRDYQLFMKRLRKRFDGLQAVTDDDGNVSYPIRFFHCGEYGDLYERPHYHACLFNFDFPDKKLWKTINGYPVWTSDVLSELWPFGFSSIGSVTFDSAAYVARYIMKKVTGDKADEHYLDRIPEYVTMSRNGGIGKEWFKKNWQDVYINGNDSVIMNGRQVKPPKYYDSQYEIVFPSDLEFLKSERKRKALSKEADNTVDRLIVREKIKKRAIKLLPRIVE